MSKWIVSANYRDRKSPYRWLVRKADEHPDQAKACKSVKATGVVFKNSPQYERGFGCSLVAEADAVEASGFEGKEPVRLKFIDFPGYFADEAGNTVSAVRELTLGEDGSMTAILPLA